MNNYIQKLEQSTIVRTMRIGLVDLIPVLMIGAFALVLKTFPVQAYQHAISTLFGGFAILVFDTIYTATFGILSVYMTFYISRAYIRIRTDVDAPYSGIMASALITFFMLIGANADSFSIDNLGVKSMFLAIVSGLGASALYVKLYGMMRRNRKDVMSSGADQDFNTMLRTIAPIAVIILFVAVVNSLAVKMFGVDSFRELTIIIMSKLFGANKPTFAKGFILVLLSSILWFFGIHGSDVLEGTMQEVFAPGLEMNQAAVAAGAEPTQILTKQFFDCFVLMGGCGTTICLLLAILLCSKNRSRKDLGKVATIPMIFNINEIMVFGLPIVYNPIMIIPFLLVPLICYTVAYLATLNGIVPVITGSVEWTTPVLLGGYHATKSLAGSMLQLFNIMLGILIYAPFVKMLDRQTEADDEKLFEEFVKFFKEREDDFENKKIINRGGVYGDIAKNLTADLRRSYNDNMVLYYQPQYNYGGKCVGVEALLRMNHEKHGILYPPLVIKLAKDGGFLLDLEKAVTLHVINDLDLIHRQFGEDIHISFNITGTTITDNSFIDFCSGLDVKDKNLCIEVTEQTTLALDENSTQKLRRLHDIGFKLAIDDFSMGHTSITYLKSDLFDFIKLDGSLVKGLNTQKNCREIVRTITQLSNSLGITVIAEYVENEEYRDILYELEVNCFQGWLYSPAVKLQALQPLKPLS